MNYHNKDMTPFDMKKAPSGQNIFLMPVIWGASFFLTRRFRLKITRELRGIKPPYLVIAVHQGFSDYYIAPLTLFPHRACYVSDMEGFANYGKRLYRNIGCIGKRRFVPDVTVVKNIRMALKKNHSAVVFPESRHSNVGTTAYIPQNLGRLAKSMGVPLCVLTVHGSYLANPFWDEERTRTTPMEAHIECLYTAEQLADTDEDVIQSELERRMQYDEYRWQYENGIKITEKFRAEGLHFPLYQCRSCGAVHCMSSKGTELFCVKCGKRWELSENGRLVSDGEEIHIPDWYEWERINAEDSADEDYCEEFSVRIEALPNEHGFVQMGEGKLIHKCDGFTLVYGETEKFFNRRTMESLHTEYNYKGRGACIVLSDKDCCYYLYSSDETFSPMRLQFLSEYFYRNLFHRQTKT